ncbi:AI-2E family transporter [Candidatus Formimonas warabiya]|nr:AI-2E family transporter [Candidatus Formimonas warabiya]
MEQKARRILTVILMITAGILVVWLIIKIRAILMPFAFAILLAYILLPPVEALVKRKIPITLAIILVYLALASAVTIFVLYIFPGIFTELNRFANDIPDYTRNIQTWMKEWQQNYSRFNLPESIRQIIDETILSLEEKIIEAVRNAMALAVGLFSYTVSLILIPFLTYYFLKDHEAITKKMVSYLPPRYREELLNLWAMMNVVLRKFIYGHLTVALIVGTLTGLGLALIGMDFAVTLGFIAGVADIIPYFGPIIGAIPAVCLALMQSKKLALSVVLVMFIVQQVESSVISPKIISDSVGLHPLVIIFVLLLGGYLFGVWGMLAAVPVTAVLRILVNYAYQKIVAYRTD